MARGENTSKHPNRRVDRPAFGPVTVLSESSPMSPKERAEHSKFMEESDMQNRYESMDRNVNFPMRSN